MLVYCILFLISFLLSRIGIYTLSGFALIAAAIYLYYKDYKSTGKIVNLRGVFLLSLIGGQGLSALKLSYLQKDWEILTWICFLVSSLSFYYAYKFSLKKRSMKLNKTEKVYSEKSLVLAIVALLILSLLGFSVEASLLGFIPLFLKGVPHAYSYFHISGVHYFTVSCVLIPALSVIYFVDLRKEKRRVLDITVILCTFIALLIPILLVSRFQFIFAIIVALVTLLSIKREMKAYIIIVAFLAIIPVYVLLSIARSHNIEYLNSIFEMRKAYPIYISQPYIYIANNYDNFNIMVENLQKHSLGLKSIFPILALTGLKFKLANLLSFPLFITKTELTTLTIIYDAYYDFGIFGVFVFTYILGHIAGILEKVEDKNPIFYLIYSQILLYFLLAFFTTWFSNPTTWFYLIITVIIYVFIDRRGYDFK